MRDNRIYCFKSITSAGRNERFFPAVQIFKREDYHENLSHQRRFHYTEIPADRF